MKLNWSDAKYVLVALIAACSAILAMGLVPEPQSQWLTVIITVAAALTGTTPPPADKLHPPAGT